jgi:glycosyltransferase 2 family protein
MTFKERWGIISKERLFSLLRLIAAVALLTYFFAQIGIEELNPVLWSVRPFYLAVYFGVLFVDALLRCQNWRALLAAKNHCFSFGQMLYAFMVSTFMGTFIPSSLGTDLSRAVLMSRRNQVALQDSAIVIVVLNLLNLLSICAIALVSALFLLNGENDWRFPLVIILICAGYIVCFPLLMRGWMPDGKRLRLPWLEKLFGKIREFSLSLRGFRDQPLVLGQALGITLVNQFLGIVIVYVVSLALGLSIPFLYLIAYVPVITLSRLIPLSVAGFGAEQGIFIFLFSKCGVAPSEAFLMSLVLSGGILVFSLVGGVAFLSDSMIRVLREKN